MSEFYTYPRYAQWLKNDLLAHNDPGFAVRALKQVVSNIRSITEDYQFEQAHAKPDSTGNPEWDRVIRAAAEMTYADRFPGCMPSWAAEGDEPPRRVVFSYRAPEPIRIQFGANASRIPEPARVPRGRKFEDGEGCGAAVDLTRKQLLVALEELDRQLSYSGVEAELRVVGGAAMALLYDEARTTADIDSVFDDYEVVRAAVEAAARELHLPPDWVNSQIHDLALPFERDHHARVLRIGENLTVRIASPQFLLYTKIIARRDAEQDFEDAVTLARHLNLVSAEQIEAEVSAFGQIDGPLELYVEEIAREL